MPTVYESLIQEANRRNKTIKEYSIEDIDKEFKVRLWGKWGKYLAFSLAVLSGLAAYYFFHLQWYYIIAVIVIVLFLSGIAFIRIPTILFDSLIAGISMVENQILKNVIEQKYSEYTIPTLRFIVITDDGNRDIISMKCRALIDVPRKGDFIHLEGLELEMHQNEDSENINKIKANHKDLFQKSLEVINVTWHPFNKIREVIILAKDPSIKSDEV